MTTAEAIPASWEMVRCQYRTPSSAARPATESRTWTIGAPPATRSTVQSCQDMPPGAPSALAMASFAANRAASEADGSSRSSGVKSFSRSRGVRSSVAMNRSTSTTSIPTPMITPGALAGPRLGQVARLADVVPLGRGQLAGEDLQRHDRHQRRHERGRGRVAEDDIGVGGDVLVAVLGDDQGARTAGPHLLDVGDDLGVQGGPARGGDDDEHRLSLVDERDRAVLELPGGEALGVDVGQLLELERPL